jgi:hypothetical protein
MQTIGKMTVPQFERLIERVIERKIYELFPDPDQGLELRPSVKTKLRRSMAAVRRGERGVPAERAAKELGLKR